MKKIIAIDNGHGMNTPGKRTPVFTDGTRSKKTGKNYMHEHEFNQAVAIKLEQNLIRDGFVVVMVSPGEVDTPLSKRTYRANAAKADLFVSIHANAAPGGGWCNANGIETFHYTSCEQSKRGAQLIQRHLIEKTKLRDRGVKTSDKLYVLRNTKMPSVLVECGFMDNLEEAKLLLSESYRAVCADAIAQGIQAYFNGDVVSVTESVKKVNARIEKVRVNVNGQAQSEGLLINSTTYIPVREVAKMLGAKVQWNGKEKQVDIFKN